MAERTAPSEDFKRTPLPSFRSVTKEVGDGAMRVEGITPSGSKSRTPLPSGRIVTNDAVEGIVLAKGPRLTLSEPRTPLPPIEYEPLEEAEDYMQIQGFIPYVSRSRTPLSSGRIVTNDAAEGIVQAKGPALTLSEPQTPLPPFWTVTNEVTKDAMQAEGAAPSGSKPRTPLPSGKVANKEFPKDVMRAEDLAFLIDCLQNTTGGNVLIDSNRVAKKRNLINYRSVANRVTIMRKRYGLPIAAAKPSTFVDESDDNGTPNKKINRGKKGKGYARKPTKKNSKSTSSKDTEVDEDAAMDTDEMERAVFGEPDEDEEDDGKPEYLAVMANDENASV